MRSDDATLGCEYPRAGPGPAVLRTTQLFASCFQTPVCVPRVQFWERCREVTTFKPRSRRTLACRQSSTPDADHGCCAEYPALRHITALNITAI